MSQWDEGALSEECSEGSTGRDAESIGKGKKEEGGRGGTQVKKGDREQGMSVSDVGYPHTTRAILAERSSENVALTAE